MHVLLVEDDPLIAQGLVAGLELQGFTLDHMAHARAAEQALQLGHFDAMILDLGLPDEDGLQLLTRIRSQGKDLPVLILSARDTVLQRVAGLQAGADDYLLKPFDLRELAARLHSLLRRSSGRSSNLIEHHGLTFDPSSQAVQLHGGIGVTDEYIVSHYFKKLTQLEVAFGDTLHHLGEVSARMQDTAGVFA